MYFDHLDAYSVRLQPYLVVGNFRVLHFIAWRGAYWLLH
jgi:hypothetical protein